MESGTSGGREGYGWHAVGPPELEAIVPEAGATLPNSPVADSYRVGLPNRNPEGRIRPWKVRRARRFVTIPSFD